jgi:hypothetical protein
MLRKIHAHRSRAIVLLTLLALTVGLAWPALPAAAQSQSTLNAPINPLPGSNTRGEMSLAADAQGGALISVRLGGLTPGRLADVNVHAGSCAPIGGFLFPLFTLQADGNGQASANAPVYNGQGQRVPLNQLANGSQSVVVFSEGRIVACGEIPVVGGSDFANALLAEGERQQVMQFNPNAALQKRIFADGFVPNSAEFAVTLEATTFAAQRAEHLGTGVVRAYFVRVGDWGNVVFAQRGRSQDALGIFMLNEAERRQAIRFNPSAALQKRIFADNFVPNSPEFAWQYGGVNYTAQRGEHLGTGRVRVYYAVTGAWGDVRFVQRGVMPPAPPVPPPAGQPAISFAPQSGPSGTVVRVTGTGFAAFAGVTLWGAPVGSQGIQMGTGITDAAGRVAFEVPVQGSPGMRWVFNLIAGSQAAQSGEYTITQ